jgi:hypothetical protein
MDDSRGRYGRGDESGRCRREVAGTIEAGQEEHAFVDVFQFEFVLVLIRGLRRGDGRRGDRLALMGNWRRACKRFSICQLIVINGIIDRN